jgi:hypothetical protein
MPAKEPALLVSPDAKVRVAAPITDAQIRLAQGFLRELDPDASDCTSSSAITRCFCRKTACTGCTDITVRDMSLSRMVIRFISPTRMINLVKII